MRGDCNRLKCLEFPKLCSNGGLAITGESGQAQAFPYADYGITNNVSRRLLNKSKWFQRRLTVLSRILLQGTVLMTNLTLRQLMLWDYCI